MPLTRKPFGERIETVEILYDDIFAGLLADWAAQGRQLAAAGAGLPDGGAEFARLGDFLGRLDGNNFATTHAADVALYRGLPLVRERVKVHVARQILTALEARATPISRRLPPWVVVAHSLGTIVAHDALDAIWTLRLPPAAVPQGGSNRFDPSQPGAKAELVMMVANVSRLLQSDPKAYVSTVMPGPPLSPVPGDPGRLRGSEHYVNTWHRFDPVTIPGRFAPVPPDWPDSAAVRDGRFQDIEVRHIHSVQIHDFLHYMADPRLHGALFQRATSPALLTDRAIERRVEEFAGSGGGLSDNAQIALKVDVESLDIGTDALWTFLLDLPKRFL
ncbi:MAG: hypothetical protein R3D25_21550 [Geminicoccaceae bacterium]